MTLYDTLYDEHGPSLKSLGWSSDEAQQIRWWTLYQEYYKRNYGTVLDAGCGFGDFSVFFRYHYKDYTGIDVKPEFIDEARRRNSLSKIPQPFNYIVGDIMEAELPHFDYVFSSGILAYQENPYDVIKRMWDLADITLGFNWYRTNLRNIILALDRCECTNYSIRHDYIPEDYTIFMHKKEL